MEMRLTVAITRVEEALIARLEAEDAAARPCQECTKVKAQMVSERRSLNSRFGSQINDLKKELKRVFPPCPQICLKYALQCFAVLAAVSSFWRCGYFSVFKRCNSPLTRPGKA
jgi:hypothetical protein